MSSSSNLNVLYKCLLLQMSSTTINVFYYKYLLLQISSTTNIFFYKCLLPQNLLLQLMSSTTNIFHKCLLPQMSSIFYYKLQCLLQIGMSSTTINVFYNKGLLLQIYSTTNVFYYRSKCLLLKLHCSLEYLLL